MAKQTIGEFLATLRKANGYTQQEVADRLGISNRTLSGWECDNVLPDILLLPVLAELYGVTVDEILAGERKEKSDVLLSGNSEKKILKSKIARFSIQCWTLLGIILAGVALMAICAFVDVTSVFGDVFPWWQVLLYVWIVPVIVCISILFASWKSAEMTVDDSSDDYAKYCLMLRKKMANSLYVLAGASFIAAILTAIGLFIRYSAHTLGIVACVTFGIATITLFVIGWLLYKHALVKFSGENARHSIKKERQYFWAVGFWGIFPIVLSVALLVVIAVGCLGIETKTTLYENDSVNGFVEYMETLIAPDGERRLPLSELARTAEIGDEFDLGDGYFAVYHRYSFTVYNEQIMILYGDEDLEAKPYSVEIPRMFVSYDNGEYYSVYNARYYSYAEQTANINYWFVGQDYEVEVIFCPAVVNDKFVKYDYYRLQKVGDGLAYVYNVVYDYSQVGYSVSLSVIAADLIVCAALCVWKRNKFSVRL